LKKERLMRYIELQGGPREIGRRHGAAFAEDIRKYFEFYCARARKTRVSPLIRTYLEERFPEVAEEIEGIGEGAGLSYEQMLAYNHFNVIAGCTPIFFSHSDVGPLLAQNLDCEREELDAAVVRNVIPDKGNAYLGVSFVGTVWVGNWINQEGVARAAVSAHHHPYRTDDGTSMAIIDRVAAQYASNLVEAFEIYRAQRCVGKVGVFLMADADGHAFMMEGNADQRWRMDVTGEFAFTTGLFTSGKVEAQDEPDYLRPKYARKETIDRLYRNGQIEFTLDGMKRLLAHHAEDPGSVCRHNRSQGQTTQSGRIMVPAYRKMYITEGPPCTAVFEEFELKSDWGSD